jgi:hypothetical protein
MKKYFLIICTICIAIIKAAVPAGAQIEHHSQSYSNGSTYLYVDGDFTYNPEERTVTYRNGGAEYHFTLKNGLATELYVNGKKIPSDSIYLYNGVILKVKEQIRRDSIQSIEDMKQAEFDRKQAEEDRKQAVKDQEEAEKDQAQAELDRQQAEEDRKQAVKDQEQAVKDREQAEEDRKQAMKEIEDSKKDQAQAELDRKQAEEDRKQAVKDQGQAVKDRAQAEEDRKQAEADRAMMKAMIKAIVNEQIVPDEASLVSFVLAEDEFVVNGKIQPEALHAKFKALYLKHPGWSISFGNFSGRNGIFMNKDDLKEKQ